MEKVDIKTWARRGAYRFFSALSQPFYSVTFTIDVTRLHDYTKRNGLSFYYALVYLASRAINSVEAFDYSLQEGELVRLGGRDPSFTDMKKGAEEFHIVTMPLGEDLERFCADAKKRSADQQGFIDAQSECASLIFISCLPWVELTAMTNERDFDRDDCVPRLTWGKYALHEGRLTLGMSVEVNHRVVDGVHIGQFAKALEAAIAMLPQN